MAEKGDKIKIKKDGKEEEGEVVSIASSGYLIAMGADGGEVCVRESDGAVVDMTYCRPTPQ